MNIATVNNAASILSGIKLNRVPDKDAKATLIKDYLALRKVAKEADADKNEIVRKFQDDWMDELVKVDALRKANKPVAGYDDFLDAEKDANKAILDLFSKEVDIDLIPVKIGAISDFPDDITLEQIAFLQDIGIVEE